MALSVSAAVDPSATKGYVAASVDEFYLFFYLMRNCHQPVKKTQKPLYFSGLHINHI
ncbi:hypothetical protein JCM19053_4761 [Vibrio sp. JCM 19053]|nr:hypothetical protein JCM19053_4761 [Vibrio sp. JCM 19053]